MNITAREEQENWIKKQKYSTKSCRYSIELSLLKAILVNGSVTTDAVTEQRLHLSHLAPNLFQVSWRIGLAVEKKSQDFSLHIQRNSSRKYAMCEETVVLDLRLDMRHVSIIA